MPCSFRALTLSSHNAEQQRGVLPFIGSTPLLFSRINLSYPWRLLSQKRVDKFTSERVDKLTCKQADKLVGEAIFSPKLVDNFTRKQADKLAGEAIFSPFHFFTFSSLNRPFHL